MIIPSEAVEQIIDPDLSLVMLFQDAEGPVCITVGTNAQAHAVHFIDSNAHPVKLLAFCKGGIEEKEQLQKDYMDQHIHHDWFEVSSKLLENVAKKMAIKDGFIINEPFCDNEDILNGYRFTAHTRLLKYEHEQTYNK